MHPMWAKLVEIEKSLGIPETSIKASLLQLEYQLQVSCKSCTETACD